MTKLFEMLSPSFLLHHALYASIVTGLACPLVGVYFILRRLVLWGVALPQVAAAGISFAMMLQGLGFVILAGAESQERHLAIIGAVAFTGAAVALLTYFERRGSGASEGRVGALYAAASAAMILFVAWNAAGETEVMGLIKGEILVISEGDFHAMLDAMLLVSACMFLFEKEFLLVSYDRDLAVALGRSVYVWDGLLLCLIALTISLAVMTVGPLVIFGFLVLPPMAARPWVAGMRSFSILSSIVGGLSGFLGFYLSYRFDLPLGPVIVATACGLLLVSGTARMLVPRRFGS